MPLSRRLLPALAPLALAALLGAAAGPAPRPAENAHLTGATREWLATRPDGSDLHLYARPPRAGDAATAPILLFLVGSGCNAGFRLKEGKLRDTLYGVVRDAAPGMVVAAPEKRGVPFGHFNGRGSGIGCPDDYTAHATLDQRVADAAQTLDALRALGHRGKRVLVIGHSEGAEVAATLAAQRPDVTHVAFLAGGGPNPMVDAAYYARQEAVRKGAKPEDVEAAVAEVEQVFRDIQAEPATTRKFFSGHAFRYWASYARRSPAEELAKAKARLFVAHGSADTHVPIESFDHLAIELIRAKKDVTIRRVPGAEHDLVPPGSPPDADPLLLPEILAWFARN